jgi:CRISPR/Cas system-associated exonuclease Cas4 (RecB family)
VITPRVTRLVRVPDLRALQRALSELTHSPQEAAEIAVLLPTRGAAIQLRRTLGREEPCAELLTREDFYVRLAHRVLAQEMLTGFEREVLLRLAARSVEKAGVVAPFKLRPGLIVEILRFYDELRRNLQTVDDFHRLLTSELAAAADTDRGAERLLRQTEFLAGAFAEFERRVSTSGRVDEHGLRSMLLDPAHPPTYSHIVVAVADRAADEHGLWPADFDLLARLPHVSRIDVVVTEGLLGTGFYQRLHERHLPGIEDVMIGSPATSPVLVVPGRKEAGQTSVAFTVRDREEELVSFARMLKSPGFATPPDRAAVVFQRPLPYLYIAPYVFDSAELPFQSHAALPLAAEPVAAALDLVLTFIASEATRGAVVALLESPHWTFVDPETGETVDRSHVDALDRWLRDTKFLGGWGHLHSLATNPVSPTKLNAGGAVALRAAASVGRDLEPVVKEGTASKQIEAVITFVMGHERRAATTDSCYEREMRARAALLQGLAGLGNAHRIYDDEPLTFAELAAAIRRWIEGHTFELRERTAGSLLIDASAAAFSDLDVVRLVGLVESDWPERASGSIFFPAKLLEPLGWPSQRDRLSAARSRVQDLLRLAAGEISASTFLLENDAIVAASSFLDEIAAAGLVVREATTDTPDDAVFAHEKLGGARIDAGTLSVNTHGWLRFRQQLAPAEAARFHGSVGPRAPATYAVSHLERYLACPFKYFAGRILGLEEEREEESGLTPQERGQFLHRVFEAFFQEWNALGHRTITADELEDALALFEAVAERHLASLREADRALERTYLLGSAVAPGLAERAFASEIEHGVAVAERLLEHALEGTFTFKGSDASRQVSLRAKADRIDLLEDGTLRIIDYKIGRAPKLSRSLQLPVYGICAQQELDGRGGRQWTISRAGYIAFKEKNAFVSIGMNLEKALIEGQERLILATNGIEAGNFPPRPDEPWLCSRCGYSLVCRKDYVGDD